MCNCQDTDPFGPYLIFCPAFCFLTKSVVEFMKFRFKKIMHLFHAAQEVEEHMEKKIFSILLGTGQRFELDQLEL